MADPYMGQIVLFGGIYAIRDWGYCQGALVDISQNQALYSIIGTAYGGDGRVTFGLPDLRGRFPLGMGQSPIYGLFQIGWVGGAQTVTLEEANLPPHLHHVQLDVQAGNPSDPATVDIAIPVVDADADLNDPTGASLAKPNFEYAGFGIPKSPVNAYSKSTPTKTLASFEAEISGGATGGYVDGNTDNTGSGQSFDIRNPFLAMNFLIALQGGYPPRN